MPEKPNEDLQGLGAMVDITYALMQHMRALQAQRGGFRYDDLVPFVMATYGYSKRISREKVYQIVSHLNQMIEQHGTMFRMVEEAPPTIAETIAGWKRMAAEMVPKKSQVQPSLAPIPRNAGYIDAAQFERYRPKPCADRWLRGAPEFVVACYDNEAADCYTVVFGGSLWDTDYARINWRAGLDPHLTPCLSLSSDPAAQYAVSSWGQCLRGRHLGRMVSWLDLPSQVRAHVMQRVAACGR